MAELPQYRRKRFVEAALSGGFAGRGPASRRPISLALAVLVALFQVALPRTPQLASGLDAVAGIGIYGPLCLAHAKDRDSGGAPPGEAPGSGQHDCAACCLAIGGGVAVVEPPALTGHILYFERFIYFPRSATVRDLRFASAIRSRAPPIPC